MTIGRSTMNAGAPSSAALAAFLGCSTLWNDPTEPASTAVPKAHRDPGAHVVLIALDGVRRQDAFSDVAPNLRRVADAGVALGAPGVGAAFEASGPHYISLPGYTEMLSGAPSHCQRNDCTEPAPFTLLDALCTTSDDDLCDVAVFASWPTIGRVAASVRGHAIVSTGRSEPEQGYRPDRETAPLALAHLESARPRFTFVSLGDCDEEAHAGNRKGYDAALRFADAFIGAVAALADQWEDDGEPTLVIITTDHGRAKNFRDHGRAHPESRETWLVAYGSAVSATGPLALGEVRRLRDIAPTAAHFLGLPWDAPPDGGSPLWELVDGESVTAIAQSSVDAR